MKHFVRPLVLALFLSLFALSARAAIVFEHVEEDAAAFLTDEPCTNAKTLEILDPEAVPQARRYVVVFSPAGAAARGGIKAVEGCYVLEDGIVFFANEHHTFGIVPLDYFKEVAKKDVVI